MKPVLVVDGEVKEIYAMHYRKGRLETITVVEEGGVHKMYNDIAEDTQYYREKPLQINFSECLKWVGQYDEIFDSVGRLITQNQSEIQNYASEIADELEVKPFVINEKVKLREELKQRTYGLMDAQDIIQIFMQDDVDLSGGEEIGSVQRMQPF